MFSNSSKYAIKAVIYLALNSNENKKVMAKDIADPINVPKAYIAKLLQELSRQNIVSSAKGPKGGFYLSEHDKTIPIRKIINVIDGENRLSSCLLSLEECNEDKPCPLHDSIFPLKTKLLDSLEHKTIMDLANDIELGNSFLPV
jgi:Rrf2 family protein